MVYRALPIILSCLFCLTALANDEEPKGFLGVKMDTREDLGGVLVTEIVAKSPAEKYELRIGDLIVRVANVEARDRETVRETIGAFRPGDRIAVEIRRGERELVLHVVLATRPKES